MTEISKADWKKFLEQDLIPKNNMTELCFEGPDIEGFVKKLEESNLEIEYVNKLMTHTLGYQPEMWKGWS